MQKANLDSILSELRDKGWAPGLTEQTYRNIIEAGLRGKNLPLAFVAVEIAVQENPLTLRGLMYRVVSAGWLPSTDKQHYARLGRLMTTLRESGIVPFSWLVDNVRSTIKPSSWAGIAEFADEVRDGYRKNFWPSLPSYVDIIVEKDAIAGTLSPVTQEYDVRLSAIRGYVSLSFAHEIAEVWNRIEKPIFAYYMGDFDASGFDLERDLRDKLQRYSGRSFFEIDPDDFEDRDRVQGYVKQNCEWMKSLGEAPPVFWERLAVKPNDFDEFNLIRLKPKKSDRRYTAFVHEHGTECAELDAIPPTELRRRVKEAIDRHIPQAEWERLQEVERIEKESFNAVLANLQEAKVA